MYTRTTRSMTRKRFGETEPGLENGHYSNQVEQSARQSTVNNRTGTKDLSLRPSSVNMAGRGGKTPQKSYSANPATPSTEDKEKNKQKGKKQEPLTLETLAELIKGNGVKMGEILDDVNSLKNAVEEWQEATETRLTELEKHSAEVKKDVSESKRLAVEADASNAALKIEMAQLRKENKLILDQLAATQAVVKKNAREANEFGREIKKYNIRFGKVADPVIPPPTGETTGPKPREDTRQVVVDFIIKHDLHPGKTATQVGNMIELAYRTGSVEKNRTRQILVKFHRLNDRKTIMINGKKKERAQTLDGAYLQDDYTQEDMSKKKRSHAFMYKLKTEEKRPSFVGGRVRTPEGFIRDKDILKYNQDNGIEDSRKKEITVDLLTLNMKSLVSFKDKDGEIHRNGGQQEENVQEDEAGKADQASGGAKGTEGVQLDQ